MLSCKRRSTGSFRGLTKCLSSRILKLFQLFKAAQVAIECNSPSWLFWTLNSSRSTHTLKYCMLNVTQKTKIRREPSERSRNLNHGRWETLVTSIRILTEIKKIKPLSMCDDFSISHISPICKPRFDVLRLLWNEFSDWLQARTQGGALGARAPPTPHLGKKFRSEISKRGDKVSPRYIGKKECARSAQTPQN